LEVMKLFIKLLRCKETPRTNLAMVSKAKKVVHGEEVTIFNFCGKVGHETHKCKDPPHPKRETHQRVHDAILPRKGIV